MLPTEKDHRPTPLKKYRFRKVMLLVTSSSIVFCRNEVSRYCLGKQKVLILQCAGPLSIKPRPIPVYVIERENYNLRNMHSVLHICCCYVSGALDWDLRGLCDCGCTSQTSLRPFHDLTIAMYMAVAVFSRESILAVEQARSNSIASILKSDKECL